MMGRFVKMSPHISNDGMKEFGVIVGYDLVLGAYVVKNLNSNFDSYSAYRLNNDQEIKTYSISEITQIIEKSIQEENNNKAIIALSFTEKLGRELYNNEKNEVEKLFRSYIEIIKQIEIYSQYANYTNIKDDAEFYKHHLTKSQKALRRIDKRFFYYFGKRGSSLQKLLIRYSCLRNIRYADILIDGNIKKYKNMLERIRCFESMIVE